MRPRSHPTQGPLSSPLRQTASTSMEFAEGYYVVRTFDPGRPPWGRWEVRDATGLLVGVIAEQPALGQPGRPSTFTVAHNPSTAPFVMRFPRHLRARGAWWSGGHETV